MDKNVPSPKKPGTDAWFIRYLELRHIGVPVVRICKDLKIPRSTLYARLEAKKKATRGAA